MRPGRRGHRRNCTPTPARQRPPSSHAAGFISANDRHQLEAYCRRRFEKVGAEACHPKSGDQLIDTTWEPPRACASVRLLSAYFVMTDEAPETRPRDAYVLTMDSKVSNVKDIVPVLEIYADRRLSPWRSSPGRRGQPSRYAGNKIRAFKSVAASRPAASAARRCCRT